MKKLLTASATLALLAGAVQAEEVKLGVLIGFTGPIESLAPAMLAGAELAAKEINDSGKFMDGSTIAIVQADTGCIDAPVAQASAERLVTSEGVRGIVGGDCSGVTGAVLQNVARPNGMVMISPSATSPALSTAEDDGLFFRTAPSDAREGEVMADLLIERGIMNIAMTYTNNDYGKGLSDAIASSFTAKGGKVSINIPHDDGKADYSAEVASLAAAGGDILVVAGYLDQGGRGIIQASLDSGAFSTFGLPGGMIGDSLPAAIGAGLNGSWGQIAGSDSAGAATYKEMAAAAGFDGTSAYSPESYDAAMLFALAMAAAGSTNPADYAGRIMDLANAPGEKIYPGEIGKAFDLIAAGTDIDFEGATAVELIGPGESAGRYRVVEVQDGKFVDLGFR
jgi:branched-chain amino acid transport system substrate-binding protein